ncbi:hypothetical protein GJ496_004303 [Pomphorhynchus laevis]|nr:hypothetical protein GJ496_004303 [Pomphorhynchus laevis]
MRGELVCGTSINLNSGAKMDADSVRNSGLKLDSLFAIAAELCPNQNWYWSRCLVARMHNDLRDASVMPTFARSCRISRG